ncbi:hypothetical protein BTO30_14635 [Domibacillus antri]|uniref:DUF1450 domain-containing protein n=1 Tax=Domibacillus antri TaxID=1714264 RepID=A0A1Q8Q2F8_9BACI|nr:hypothetical protein BTO30_14635 [Domibacillus antri]
MIEKVSFCSKNLVRFSGIVQESIEKVQDPKMDTKIHKCLRNCRSCSKRPFILINDLNYIHGLDNQDLLKKINAEIGR